jgi:hypothetical protein
MEGCMKTLLVVLAFIVGPAAFAEEPETVTEGGNRFVKTTVIDFEGDTIEGDLSRPDGEYVEARKTVKHSNLIRIREEFKEKVMQSVGEL